MSKESSRRLAMMFTDLVGYSTMMAADEHEAISRLDDYRELIFNVIKTHQGRVIDFAGDSIFACFSGLEDAVNAALEIQRALQQYNKDHCEKLYSRIGLHYGDVLEKDGSIYGDDVNIAARLEALGDPEGVCISETVYLQLDARLQKNCVFYGQPVLKNIGDNLKVFHLFQHPVKWGKWFYLQRRRINNYLAGHPVISVPLVMAILVLTIYLLASVFSRPLKGVHTIELGEILNLSQGEVPEYYTIGVADEIRTRIKRIPSLFLSPPEDGADAEVTLTGSLQQLREQVRISYQITRRADGEQIGSGSIDGKLSNMLALQSELADNIVNGLATELHLELPKEKVTRQKITAEAYQYYLQAREYAKRPDDRQTLAASISLYKNALQIDDTFAAAYAGLCDAYWGAYLLERSADKVNLAEQACLRAESLNDNLAEVQIALGEIYRGRGKFDRSISAYNKAISLEPRNIAAFIGLADAYASINKFKLAEQTYLRAVGLQPGNWKAWVSFGRYQFNRGQFERAESSFRKVIALTPDNVNAYANLGAALLFQGRVKQAAQVFNRQAELEPSATILSNLATMYYYDGNYKDARDTYRKAIELSPEQCQYWSNLADALHQITGNKAQAVEADKHALELCQKEHAVNPQEQIILITQSRLLARLGRTDEALSIIESFNLTKSSDPDAQLYLALAFLQSGEMAAMKSALDQAVKQGYPRSLVLVEPEFIPYHDKAWFISILENAQPE
jgi:class 3 adenylate cyclase/tetratricopeptide (TPR) repeat protein